MVQLVDEVVHLCFQISDLAIGLTQVHLLALQVHGLGVDQAVQLLHLVEHLGDFELKAPDVAGQVLTLSLLEVACRVELVDLLEVLAISLTQSSKLIVALTLLRSQACVGVLLELKIVLYTLDVDVALRDECSLTVELSVKVSILTLTLIVDASLLVNLGS